MISLPSDPSQSLLYPLKTPKFLIFCSSKKRWSPDHERQLLSSITLHWPVQIPKEKIKQFAIKWGRTETSIRSKIQKIRKRYQNSAERELDKLNAQQAFNHHQDTSNGHNDHNQPQNHQNSKNGKFSFEQNKILKKILVKRARDGMPVEKLRSYLPKQIIDDFTLNLYLAEFGKNGLLERRQEMLVDLADLNVKDIELYDYLRGFVESDSQKSVYRINELFPVEASLRLKQRFISTFYSSIRNCEFIYWVG